MSEMSSPTRIAALLELGETRQQVRAALQAQPEFELVLELNSSEDVTKQLRAAMPELILIEQPADGQPSLDLIDELTAEMPEAAIVALLASPDATLVQHTLLAGVRTFLVKPFTQVSLIHTLRRLRELESRRKLAQTASSHRPAQHRETLQTITIFSPRGGVGCSTLAVNLAVAIHQQLETRVLLVEGKLLFGHLGLMLNLRPQNTLADLIPHAGSLDAGLVEEVVTQHATGIHVLLSPPDPHVAQGIRPDDLYKVAQGVGRVFDVVIVDAGSFLNDNAVTLMDVADRVLLVTTPELASLHDVSRFIQLSRTLGFPPEKLITVLNRVGMPGGVKVRDIKAALPGEIYALIPDESVTVTRSLNRGIPLVFKSPRSNVGKAIQGLAGKLLEGSTGQSPAVESAKAGRKGWLKAHLRRAPRKALSTG
ncbi:MAG TPA: P-loop NTPase [Anaerolineales bacterium]|nr:P-loop NTPase [Anaerolineales bacterium]